MSPSASSILYRTAHGIAIAAVLAFMPPAASADPAQQTTAAEDAKKFGTEQQKQQFNSATMLTPSTLANMPTSTRPDATKQSPTTQRGLFQGGQGAAALINAATTASTECSKDKTTLDCQAANLQAGQVSTSSATANIKSSPMYATDKSIFKGTRDATTASGILSSYVGGSQSVCSTDTISTPAVFEKETCIEYANPAEQKCTVGQTVVVDPDYLYECKIRTNKDVGQGCGVGQKVVVDQDYLYQCTQRNASDIGKNCTVGKEIIVDPDYKYQCGVKQRTERLSTCNSFLRVACKTYPMPPCNYLALSVSFDAIYGCTFAICGSGQSTLSNDGNAYSIVLNSVRAATTLYENENHRHRYVLQISDRTLVASARLTNIDGANYTKSYIEVNGTRLTGLDINDWPTIETADFKHLLRDGVNEIALWPWGDSGIEKQPVRLNAYLSIESQPYCPPAPPPDCTDQWDTSQCDALAARPTP